MLPHLNNYFGKYKAIIMMAKTTKLRLIKDKSSRKFSQVQFPKHGGLPARAPVRVCLFWTPPFHTVLLDSSLSLGPSIVPWTRLLGTNLVFLSPPVISLCLHLNRVTPKNTKPPSHQTGPTNRRISLQWISCPTFLCCQKNAGLRSALELNWSRKLFHCNKGLMITAVMRPYCTCQDESSPLP